MKSRLLAIDWGSTSVRGALLDESGAVTEVRSKPRGMLTVPPGAFAGVFEECFGDWMEGSARSCLMSGMVGSRQGWLEAPYCQCPAALADVAAAVVDVPAFRECGWKIAVVPGLSCWRDDVPDVMRGEEAQIFGALGLLGLEQGRIVLPGTHSKWTTVRQGRIGEFTTMMSGEFYALLKHHSILARSLPRREDGGFDERAFDQGVAQALRSATLLQTAFTVRTLSLFERLAPAAAASYLSGLVIGEELRCCAPESGSEVIVIGASVLAARYERALRLCGVRARVLGDEATWHGLWAIHRIHRDAAASA